MPSKSVTHWIQQLHGGDEQATQEIWSRYFKKLVRLARKHLHPLPRRAFDEQDVALSAFNSFFQGVSQGRFPQLNDRHDLWKMEGYTNSEIADKLGCAPRTVERKLERIRAKWEQEAVP